MGATTLVRILANVVLFILLARQWSPNQFGSFMYAFTLSSLIALAVDFGFGQYILREVGRDRERVREVLRDVLVAKSVLTGFAYLLSIILAVLFPSRFGVGPVYFVLLTACVVLTFCEAINAVSRALDMYSSETKVVFVSNAAFVVVSLSALFLFEDELAVAASMLLCRVLYLILSFRVLPNFSRKLFDGASFWGAFPYIRSRSAYGADSFLTNFFSSMDTIVIQYIFGPSVVGVYQAGVRLVQGVNTFSQVVSNVFVSKVAISQSEVGATEVVFKRQFFVLILIGGGCSTAFSSFPAPLVHLIYGEKYMELVAWLPIFGLLLLLRYVASGYGIMLAGLGLQSSRAQGIALCVVAFALAVYVLKGSNGVSGIIYALVFSTLLLGGYYRYAMNKRGGAYRLGQRNILLLVVFLFLTCLNLFFF